MPHELLGEGYSWMVNEDGNAREECACYCTQVKGINLISLASMIKRKLLQHASYDVHYDNDNKARCMQFNGQKISNTLS